MRKFILRLSVILITFLFFNCSSDSDSESAPAAKTKVKISSVKINVIPTTNGSVDWDFSSAPDIYIAMHDETSTTSQAASNTVWDYSLTTATPLLFTINPGITTIDLINTIFTVQVYDDDTDDVLAGENDYIGEVAFRISDYTSGDNKYPSMVYKVNGGTMITLSLTWE